MTVIETDRLLLRRFVLDDAPFILALLNVPSFIQYIGDRGVRTLDDARRYLETGPLASYARHGYGLYLAVRKQDAVPIGMCGLLRRESLDAPDIGYAFLPAYWSQGYASEAAAATLDYGWHVLGLSRIIAITAPENYRSIKLLEKLGLRFERMARLAPDNVVMLFSIAGSL
jgi:[ribosomal protein S5]-alanine N-acetyltransferase